MFCFFDFVHFRPFFGPCLARIVNFQSKNDKNVCKMTTAVDGSKKFLEKNDNAINDNDGVGADRPMTLLVVSGASSTAFMPISSHSAMVPLP